MFPPHKSSLGSVHPFSSRPSRSSLIRRSTAVIPPDSQQLKGLDFRVLAAFERVSDRFAHLGIHFEGTIALEPSNPLFYNPSELLVLMAVSDAAGITARFDSPMQQIEASISSVRPVLLTAYDENGNTLEQVSTDWEQVYTEEGFLKAPLPQQRLTLRAHGIRRITFHCYAPFTLTGLKFA